MWQVFFFFLSLQRSRNAPALDVQREQVHVAYFNFVSLDSGARLVPFVSRLLAVEVADGNPPQMSDEHLGAVARAGQHYDRAIQHHI